MFKDITLSNTTMDEFKQHISTKNVCTIFPVRVWVNSRCISGFQVSLLLFFWYLVGKFSGVACFGMKQDFSV